MSRRDLIGLNRDTYDSSFKQWRTKEFCSEWGSSTNSVEDRENGDLGAVAPWSGVLDSAVI